MAIDKEDLLEALGWKERGFSEWVGPTLLGFSVGALIGATVALFLAPRSGSELRQDLMGRGRRFVQRGREQLDEAMEDVKRPEPRNY